MEKNYFHGNILSNTLHLLLLRVISTLQRSLPSYLFRSSQCGIARPRLLQIEFQFGKRVALSRHEGLAGSGVSGPMWAGQVWGPSHSRTSPLRRQSLSLFRSFRGIGISDHQPCKKSSEENKSPGSTQRPYRGTVDAYARPLYGPIWPDPKPQNVAEDQPCTLAPRL